ncbi:Putative Heat shock protein 70 family [Septoria linicola]|uniref:Heat shock protein 70 family n=1 Tax=Septoria linicola TaxID=215465 RepID=A0A9Q9ASK1_9PEZI|nr:putative Heat shock protein 70 family [Septoria linicola]USW49976.1 Putative Heat shock protein 70 family [Septoria linicola]
MTYHETKKVFHGAGYYIEVAFDWGTSKCIITFVICRDGQRGPVTPLLLGDRSSEVKSMASWINGQFMHGHKLQKEANKNRKLSDKIITLFKLPLYRGPETSEITKRVEGILAEFPGKPTLDTLIEEHLKAILNDAKAALRNNEAKVAFHAQPELFEALLEDIRVVLSVPHMWGPDARQRMQSAAKRAGFKVVKLASEPQCALAYLTDKASRNPVLLKDGLHKGDSILVADLGCGTGDFVHYQLLNALSLKSKFKGIGHTSGDVSGSLRVDEALLATLKGREDGRDWIIETQDKLNVTERDLDRRLLVAIEQAKESWTEDEEVVVGTVYGVDRKWATFEITKEEIQHALDQVIDKVCKELDSHIKRKKPTVIMMTGGFAKSSYLMKTLRKRYEPGITVVRPNETDTGACFPVAMGALMRYDNITTSTLPSRYGYAMLQRQEFDEDMHEDSCRREDRPNGKEHVFRKKWVKPSPYDENVYVVDDRLAIIIEKGTVLTPGHTFEYEGRLEYRLPFEDPVVNEEFVFLTKRFEQNEMAKRFDDEAESSDKAYVLRDGIHAWRSLRIPLEKEELSKYGFRTIEVDEEKFWLLNVKLSLRVIDQDIQIVFDFLKPSKKRKLDEDDEPLDEFAGESAFVKRDTIFEANHSEFVD